MERRMCTGTLLAATWVLTAAHCTVDSVQYGNMTVWPTQSNSSRLLKRIAYPSFGYIKQSDIAMLLIEKIHLKEYGKLSALDYRTLFGFNLTWIGGGLTTWDWDARHVLHDYVRPLQLGIGVALSCTGYVELKPTPVGTHICVAGPCDDEQYVMPADSGGPLFLEDKVVGVAYELYPLRKISVFTAVSPFLTWIAHVMESNK